MSDNPEETECYLRIFSMYIDIGTDTVRKIFYYCKPEAVDIDQFFSRQNTRKIVKDLKRKNVLKTQQYNLVSAHYPNIEKFDIVLLLTLLTNLFPSKDLPPPQTGWKDKPNQSDLSIGADLIRLKKIRNSVLCHRPKAQLPRFQFDHYWSLIETILLRLIRQIQPEEEDDLRHKIEQYKSRTLDTALAKEYEDILRNWETEVDAIQTQVEELLGTLKEFDIYFKNKPGRFKRYVRLMRDGGKLVLKAVLNRELSKQRISLTKFLKENEASLKVKIANIHFIDSLYPKDKSHVENSSADDWDVSLLVEVVLNSCKELEPEDKEDIEAIQSAHNSYADTALLSLNSDRFAGVLIELTNRLTSVANSLSKEVKRELKDLIASCSKADDEDGTSAEEYLDTLQEKGSNIKSLADLHKETIAKLKESLNQMEVEGIRLKTEQKLEIKFQTNSRNRETAEKAEDAVYTVLHEAIRKSIDTSGLEVVRQEIDKILESLTAHVDVTKIEVQRHCIIIEIYCSSTSGIQHVISIFESNVFQNLLHNVAMELTSELSDTVAIQSNFTLESLNDNLNRGNDDQEDREIVIQVPFSSAADLKRIISPFESRELTNSANRISGYLSNHFDETVTLLVSHEMKGISDSDTSTPSPKSEDFETEDQLGQFLKVDETQDQENGNEYTNVGKPRQQKNILVNDTSSPPSTVQKSVEDVDEFSIEEDIGRLRYMCELCNEHPTEEETSMSEKYCQLVIFVIDICPKPLRRCFIKRAKAEKQHMYMNLENYLQERKQDILNLQQQYMISPDQYANIYPEATSVDIRTWDVSLLTTLLLRLFQAEIQQEETDCISTIQRIWNKLKHIGNSSFMTPHMFQHYSDDLQKAVHKLSQSAEESWQHIPQEDLSSALTKPMETIVTVSHMNEPVSHMNDMFEKLEKRLELESAEIQSLKEETKQSHKILTKSSVKSMGRSGKKQLDKKKILGVVIKRMKIIDSKVERMKDNLRRALAEPNNCEETHRQDILRIYQKLCDNHHVIVTGHNNSIIYKCALAAVKMMKSEQCLEINNPSDWKRICSEDAGLVLFREPFGMLTYDVQKVEVMLEEFDSMLDATVDGDEVIDIIMVTSQTRLSEVVRHYDHDMLSQSYTVIIEDDEDNTDEATARKSVQTVVFQYLEQGDLVPTDNQYADGNRPKKSSRHRRSEGQRL